MALYWALRLGDFLHHMLSDCILSARKPSRLTSLMYISILLEFRDCFVGRESTYLIICHYTVVVFMTESYFRVFDFE